ncbi:MAG: putative ATP-dependent endonuclease of OLD family [Psychromonas sp.]|jgi:putative ATP-dependent endonuclease of OLD family|uniref:ATP-dependent endonuclease n=1 Tax=Psychromonas sp. TaxID=1884585 RepID=UPI0039E22D02
MLLDQIEVVGFRGINRLSINVKSLSAFLGENSWGKSSLFDALSLFLSGTKKAYKFTYDDFHQPPISDVSSNKLIHLVFTFKEQTTDESLQRQYKSITAVWNLPKEGARYIYYQIDGSITESGHILTERYFLDNQGQKKSFEKALLAHLVSEFTSFVPVLRMGSELPMMATEEDSADLETHSKRESCEARIKRIFKRLNNSYQQLSESEMKMGYQALVYLFDHYLLKHYGQSDFHRVDALNNTKGKPPFSFQALTHFNDLLKTGHKNDRAMLLLVLGEFLEVRGEHLLRRGATPVLLLEEPENNLHPVNLAITWRFFSLLPMQKLVSTNSSQLLSFLPLGCIQRLVRSTGLTNSYSLNLQHFSQNDLRRIAFHVRMTRPQSLFARSWLLVEGETETWLLTELSRLCGYNLVVEGVQIIEFAQCGVAPLIKLAQDLHIEWSVLTDGDAAGKKYAARVTEMLLGKDSLVNRLLVLPALDIEHLFFDHGFADIYLQAANYTEKDLARIATNKIIDKAVHKHSKPGLGLAIANAVEERGADSIPPLLKRLFSRLVGLARSQSG